MLLLHRAVRFVVARPPLGLAGLAQYHRLQLRVGPRLAEFLEGVLVCFAVAELVEVLRGFTGCCPSVMAFCTSVVSGSVVVGFAVHLGWIASFPDKAENMVLNPPSVMS